MWAGSDLIGPGWSICYKKPSPSPARDGIGGPSSERGDSTKKKRNRTRSHPRCFFVVLHDGRPHATSGMTIALSTIDCWYLSSFVSAVIARTRLVVVLAVAKTARA